MTYFFVTMNPNEPFKFQGFETVPNSSLVTEAALQALEDFLNGGGGKSGAIEIGKKKIVN